MKDSGPGQFERTHQRRLTAGRRWVYSAIALLILCSASMRPVVAQELASLESAADELRIAFKSPAKAYRPMVRWWWPLEQVADDELRREIGLMDEAQFGGAEIQPLSWPGPQAQDALTEDRGYLSPTFFSHVRAALQEARQRGMWLDYTFGSSWPFGGGKAITPELATMELRFSRQVIHGPTRWHGQLQLPDAAPGTGSLSQGEVLPPGWQERLKQREKVIAVVAVRGEVATSIPTLDGVPDGPVKKPVLLAENSSRVLTSHASADGILDWDVPAGDWQIFTFVQLPADMRVASKGSGPRLVIDHLKRAAFDAYAHRVGDGTRQQVGDFFGQGLRAIFSDSYEVMAYMPWTDNLLAEFRRRRGYDLTPFLPILKVPGFAYPHYAFESPPIYDIPGIGERVRHDYWQTVSDLLMENFFQPFADWASKNKLLSRVQAHGAPVDLLRAYGTVSIPETEHLYDNGRYDFLKMAASAANVYGRKIVSSESFSWQADGAGGEQATTPELIKRSADELFTAGVNEIVFHGFPYEYMEGPEPGWSPFANSNASHFNHHNPFWKFLPPLNAYITRLQYIFQQGTSVAPVALYRGQLAYDSIQPLRPEPQINLRLLDAGYGFDHFNTHALLGSRVVERELISPGGARYRVLVLQDERRVPEELVEKLLGFAAEGLPIVFIGDLPGEEVGYLDFKQRSSKIRASMAKILTYENIHHAKSLSDAMTELGLAAAPNVRFLSGSPVPLIEKKIESTKFFFLRNPDLQAKELDIEIAANGSPEIWDPWTGDAAPLRDFARHGRSIGLHVTIPPYGSKLIVFDGSEHTPIAARPSVPKLAKGPVRIDGGGWSFRGVGFGVDGGRVAHEIELPRLIDWSQHSQLRDFSGTGIYRTNFRVDADWLGSGHRIVLSLGEVRDVAEVKVNDQVGPTLLIRPYEVDITPWVRPGDNALDITVTSTLVNVMAARSEAAGPAAASEEPALSLAAKQFIAGLDAAMAVSAAHSPIARGSLQRIPGGLIGPVTLSVYATDSDPSR